MDYALPVVKCGADLRSSAIDDGRESRAGSPGPRAGQTSPVVRKPASSDQSRNRRQALGSGSSAAISRFTAPVFDVQYRGDDARVGYTRWRRTFPMTKLAFLFSLLVALISSPLSFAIECYDCVKDGAGCSQICCTKPAPKPEDCAPRPCPCDDFIPVENDSKLDSPAKSAPGRSTTSPDRLRTQNASPKISRRSSRALTR
jgi:hypothetical protein